MARQKNAIVIHDDQDDDRIEPRPTGLGPNALNRGLALLDIIADAPRPDEMLVALVLAIGGRPLHRVKKPG